MKDILIHIEWDKNCDRYSVVYKDCILLNTGDYSFAEQYALEAKRRLERVHDIE